jgi:hypothetical protein
MKTGLLLTMLLLSACSRSNNLLLGRVQADVGSHTVVVTDCYRTSVPPPQRLPDAAGQPVYRFMPCRDADVSIRGDELLVNGQSYGRLNPTDAVLVDHGVVSIVHEPR